MRKALNMAQQAYHGYVLPDYDALQELCGKTFNKKLKIIKSLVNDKQY